MPEPNIRILVDADACPVKEEVYKVAWRREVAVTVVSNSHFRVPAHPLVERVVVSDRFDAADDWIADQAGEATVVITGDIPLAERCLKKGAIVIGHNGKPFTVSSTAARSRRGRSWRICGSRPTGSPAGRRRSPRPIARDSCRRWTERWRGLGGITVDRSGSGPAARRLYVTSTEPIRGPFTCTLRQTQQGI